MYNGRDTTLGGRQGVGERAETDSLGREGGGGDAVTDREREQRNSVKFPFL